MRTTSSDNVAIASEGTGIWFSFVNRICCAPAVCTAFHKTDRPSAADCVALHGPDAQLTSPLMSPTRENARNVAASNVVGINWDGAAHGALANNPRNPADRSIEVAHYAPIEAGHAPPVFADLVMYKNSNTAQYFRGGQSYFLRQVYADNGKGPFMAYNSALRDSLMVGWSANAEVDFFFDPSVKQSIRLANGFTSGLRIYDGPLQVEGVHFAGFPLDNDAYAESRPHGLVAAPAAVPIAHVGAAERFTSVAAHLTWEGGVAPARIATWPLDDSLAGVQHGQGCVVYDVYGELSGVSTAPDGTAPLTVIGDWPINGDASCRRVDLGSGTMTCGPGYSTAVLAFANVGGSPSHNPNFRVVRTLSSSAPSAAELAAAWDSLRVNFVILKMVSAPVEHYHFVRLDWTAETRLIVFRADRSGDISPPIHLYWEAHQCAGKGVRISPSAGFVTQPDAASVVGASDGAVYYDDAARTLVMRVKATRERCADAGVVHCGPLPVSTRFAPGTLANGSRTAAYQSEPFTLRCADSTNMEASTPETLETPKKAGLVGTGNMREAMSTSAAAGGGVRWWGWACVIARSAPVFLQALAYSATGEALELLPPTPTSDPAEAAVHGACGNTPAGALHRFDVTLQLPPGKSWDDFGLITLKLGGTSSTMVQYGRPFPAPTAGQTLRNRDDRIAEFEAYRDSLRANPLWGYALPGPSSPSPPAMPPGGAEGNAFPVAAAAAGGGCVLLLLVASLAARSYRTKSKQTVPTPAGKGLAMAQLPQEKEEVSA